MKRLLLPLASVAAIVTVARCSCAGDGTDEPKPDPTVFARQITSAEDLVGGPDAVGGIGDWYLGNELVEVIIDDVKNQNATAASGGTLVDFALKGQDNDQFNSMYQLFAVSQDYPVLYDEISSSTDADGATITVKGHVFAANPEASIPKADVEACTVTTSYRLVKNDPALRVHTELVNSGTNAVASGNGTPVSDVILWGNRGQVPFTPYRGRGFWFPELDVRNPIGAFGAFLYVAARGDVDPPVSYGIVGPAVPDGLIAGVNTEQITAVGLRPVGGPLAPGGKMVYDRYILIAKERTIEAIASQAFAILRRDAPTLIEATGAIEGHVTGLAAGRTAELTAQLPATILGTKPMNSTTVSGDGAFHLTLPPGTYELSLKSGADAPVIVSPVTVTSGNTTQAPAIVAPGLAAVAYTITSDGAAKPSRLTFKGVAPTPDPALGPRFSGKTSRNLVYTVDGKGTVSVEAGTYDVYASRGLEYSLAHERITVKAGDSKSLTFALTKVVATPGMISGDFHVHSGASFDASVEVDTRILNYAAEGVEVAVSTDHDVIFDYAPSVAKLGLVGQIATIVGVEATGFVPTPELPRTIGHNNAWPLKINASAPRHGMPSDERIEPGELYDRLRAIGDGNPVIQLNHPRADAVGTVGLGYFTNFGFTPTTPVPSGTTGKNGFLRRKSPKGTDNLAYDAQEVINGAAWDSIPTSQQNRDDWFSLLRQGIIRAGMANSDSHQVAEAAGFPRTYVRYEPDAPAPLVAAGTGAAELSKFDEAIRALHVMGTNGPIIVATIDGKGPGDTVTSAAKSVNVIVHVEAAPWIPVDEVRIIVNGKLACRIDHEGATNLSEGSTCSAGLSANPADPYGTTGATRYDGGAKLEVGADSFVIVEAGAPMPLAIDKDEDGVLDTWDSNGDGKVDEADTALGGLPKPTPAAIANNIVPGLMPWAFTNPIFLDTGAAGWTAPGL